MLQHPTSVATKVVCLTQVVREEELKDDLEYEDIVEDMKQEGEKFGKSSVIVTFILLSLLINPQNFIMVLIVFLVIIFLFYSLFCSPTFCYKESGLTFRQKPP